MVLLAGLTLILAGFAVAQFRRPADVEPALGSICRSRSGDARRTCYQRVLTGHLDKYGVADAVATLDSFAAYDPDLRIHAHEYAHGIGRLAYSRYPDVASTFVACGDRSASGCRHGFMQTYLESQKRITANELQGFCRPLDNEQYATWLLLQCLHGLGHGLTMFHDHDIPRALRDCELLNNDWQRQSCYGGAFMESFTNATSSHHHVGVFKAVDSTDLSYPCSIMAQRYLFACYQMQTTIMLYLNGGDFGGAARECDRAPAAMREPCYESLGRDVTTYAAGDPRKSAQLCAEGSSSYRPACYGSAVRSLVNLDGRLDRSLALCREVASREADTATATRCYWYLGNTISMLIAAGPDRAAACARVPAGSALAACREGARL